MNKRRIILITSLLCILPMIFSMVVYNNLPNQVAVHWDSAGNPDNYAHKAFAAFGLPLILLALNIISKIKLFNDPKERGQSAGIKLISIWLIPILSLVLNPITMFIALGVDISISLIATLIVGVIMIIIGNYLPKSRQNYTIGIKNQWTLSNVDVWNSTHRMAGILYILGGLVIIIGNFFFRNTFAHVSLTLIVVALLVLVPMLYSFFLYKKVS